MFRREKFLGCVSPNRWKEFILCNEGGRATVSSFTKRDMDILMRSSKKM
jgi:hypothetical protein